MICTRLGAGALGAFAPGQIERQLGCSVAASPVGSVLARLFAARDVGYGIGLAASEARGRRLWLAVGVATDLADAATMAVAFRAGSLSAVRATAAGAVAIAAAGVGLAALRGPDITDR